MNIESIGYRYTPEELSALLKLLRLPDPPGIPLKPLSQETFDQVCVSLRGAGLTVNLGHAAGVDRLSTLLLSSASKCRAWLRIDAPNRALVLWRCEGFYLAGDLPQAGPWALTPLQTADDADTFAMEAVSRLLLPSIVTGSNMSPTHMYSWSTLPEILIQKLH